MVDYVSCPCCGAIPADWVHNVTFTRFRRQGMTDLIKRLRDPHPISSHIDDPYILYEAADEIERLREALHKIADRCPIDVIQSINAEVAPTLAYAAGFIARSALEGKSDD